MTLLEWVASVRKKFGLPRKTSAYPAQRDYWDGYEACLRDVERFAKGAEGSNDGQSDSAPAALAPQPDADPIVAERRAQP